MDREVIGQKLESLRRKPASSRQPTAASAARGMMNVLIQNLTFVFLVFQEVC